MTQRNLKDLLTKEQIQQLNLGVTSVLKDLLTDEQIQYLKSVVGSLASQRFTEFRDTSDHPTMVMFRSVWEQTRQKSEKDSEEILHDFKEKNPSFADEFKSLENRIYEEALEEEFNRLAAGWLPNHVGY